MGLSFCLACCSQGTLQTRSSGLIYFVTCFYSFVVTELYPWLLLYQQQLPQYTVWLKTAYSMVIN